MKHGYKGFTLLELMLVVTVIGILATVAVPAYIDNYKRARAAEIVSSSYGLKSAIQVCMTDFPEDYEANCVAGLNYIPENLDSGDAAVALAGSKMIRSRAVANGTPGVNGPITRLLPRPA